jgi:hypothetical protein
VSHDDYEAERDSLARMLAEFQVGRGAMWLGGHIGEKTLAWVDLQPSRRARFCCDAEHLCLTFDTW